ncbi:unnamed protein product [Amoebophrya sp. A120]|nr:unnamed protein product [Amoebophrya sp. A120]|eukprot:GSA120T00015460001.1
MRPPILSKNIPTPELSCRFAIAGIRMLWNPHHKFKKIRGSFK